MSEIVVRPATEEDAAEIARIYGHYVLHTCATFETEAPSREEMARRRLAVLELGLPYLTAEAEGRVIGLCLRERIPAPCGIPVYGGRFDLR